MLVAQWRACHVDPLARSMRGADDDVRTVVAAQNLTTQQAHARPVGQRQHLVALVMDVLPVAARGERTFGVIGGERIGEQTPGGLIHTLDISVGVVRNNAVGGRLEDCFELSRSVCCIACRLRQQIFSAFAGRHVLNDRDDVERLPLRPPHKRRRQVAPDGLAVFADVALLRHVRRRSPCEQLLRRLQIGLQVIGMGDLGERAARQLVWRIPQDACIALVHAKPAAIRRHKRHANVALLEERAESLLALAQLVVQPVALARISLRGSCHVFQLDIGHRNRRQVLQCGDILLAPHMRLAIDNAEGADDIAVRGDQRYASVGDDV